MRWNKVLYVVVAAAIVGGAGYAGASWATGSASTRSAGDGRAFASGAPLDSSFAAIAPCRIVDTRKAAGFFEPKESRKYDVRGAGSKFALQGGKVNGCGIPASGVTSVQVTITSVSASGTGFVRAFPASEPEATFMNYGDDFNTSGSGPVTLCTTCAADQDLTVRNYGSNTEIVVDVTGYYSSTMTAFVRFDGVLLTSQSNRATAAVKDGTGEYTVTFDRNVSECAVIPALGQLSGKSGDIAASGGNGLNKIAVAIEDNQGDLVDQNFVLHVLC